MNLMECKEGGISHKRSFNFYYLLFIIKLLISCIEMNQEIGELGDK